jgi:hypothetical protein
MSRISQNKSKEDFPERLKKNYLIVDSLDIDSFNSNSYIEDFDLEPNLSIPKILNDFNNFSNNIKNHNKNLGNKNDAKLEKTISLVRAQNFHN